MPVFVDRMINRQGRGQGALHDGDRPQRGDCSQVKCALPANHAGAAKWKSIK